LTVKFKLEGEEEKIMALIHRRIPSIEIAKFNAQIDEKEISISLPEDSFYLEGVQYAKRGIASDIQKFFSNFEKIMFVESFIKVTPPSDEKPLESEDVQEDTLNVVIARGFFAVLRFIRDNSSRKRVFTFNGHFVV
jgi:hypothetical protein